MLRFIATMVFAGALAGCSAPAASPSSQGRVSLLPGLFVSPESCARFGAAWIVSDKGCAPAQPCWSDPASRRGAVISVSDDGTRTTLIDGLTSPNGVAVDAEGNVWVVDGKAGDVVVRAPDGTIVRQHVEGAGLLNDVTAVPWGPSTVVFSDTKSGELRVAALDDGAILLSSYLTLAGAPNGVAASHAGDGVVVSGLGDLAIPGRAGGVSAVGPSDPEAECGEYRGGAPSELKAPPHRKLDGVVPFTRGGVAGYVVSSIVDTTQPADDPLDASLWFVAPGRAPELLMDLRQLEVDGARARSAADLGVDDQGRLCVPDLNGTTDPTDGAAGARVFLVEGL